MRLMSERGQSPGRLRDVYSGRQFLLDLKDCNRESLNDLEFLKNTLISVAEQCGAQILGESFYCFEPQGVSGVVLNAGSHLCIHTWPEFGYAAIDILTYNDLLQPEEAARLLIDKLEAKSPSIAELKRGV
jgi:S-adenosylmethionine decarboxylase proenzyme